MKDKKIIITSSDSKYFHLVKELYNSVKIHNLHNSFDFGILDTGLLENQIEEAGLSESELNKAKFEQKKILKDLDKIKSDIDRMMNESEEIIN